MAIWHRTIKGHPAQDTNIIRPRHQPRDRPRLRADWRFLLPSSEEPFAHFLLLGGSESLAKHLVDIGFALHVYTDLSPNLKADAIAVLNLAEVDLKSVVRHLAPGGVFYGSVSRRSARYRTISPSRLRHRLRQLGQLPQRSFWVAPNLSHPRRYIPLDSLEALRWYLTTLYLAGTLTHKVIGHGLSAASRLNHRLLEELIPCYSVTACNANSDLVLPAILKHPSLPAALHQPNLQPMLLTSAFDEGSRLVMLPFVPGVREPLAVLKVAARPDFSINTELEQATMIALHGRLNDAMRLTIPAPLARFNLGSLPVRIETCAAGPSLWVSSGRWRAPWRERYEDLRYAADWLSEFHRQTEGERTAWNHEQIDRWIAQPIAVFKERFGVRADEAALFDAMQRRASLLLGQPFPLVWQHYDFGPWNLYREQERFFVIDWEFGRHLDGDRFGPTLCDLLYFIKYWLHLVCRLHDVEAELKGLDLFLTRPAPSDEIATKVHQTIAQYLVELGVDKRFYPLLLVYTWMEQAIHQAERKETLRTMPHDALKNNRPAAYVRYLARHAVQLFDEF